MRHRDVVLDEVDRNAGREVGLAVIGLDIVAAEILEHGRRLDQQDRFELCREYFHPCPLLISLASRRRREHIPFGWNQPNVPVSTTNPCARIPDLMEPLAVPSNRESL